MTHSHNMNKSECREGQGAGKDSGLPCPDPNSGCDSDFERIIFETRICAEAICPTASNGKRYPARLMFRRESDTHDMAWMEWHKGAYKGNSISRKSGSDCAISSNPNHPWGNRNANVYRDHCVYCGNDSIGYERHKDRVIAVKGFMLDFDSHTNRDMPLSDIAAILAAPDFAAKVPCSRILMTGNGYQLHFDFPRMYPPDEPERNDRIGRYEALIQATMDYFRQEWKLKPDEQCKDITRLHRHYPSYNVKKMTAFDDDANRIPVEEILSRGVNADEVESFFKGIWERYPVKPVNSVKVYAPAPKTNSPQGDPPAQTADERLAKVLRAPCMKRLWDEGAGEGSRNACRFAILSELRSEGADEDEAYQVLSDFNERCDPPDEDAAIRTQTTAYYRSSYSEALAKPP